MRLELLSGFELSCGSGTVDLPLVAQRLVAFLALHTRPLHRLFVAGNLWTDASEERASASLRTTLWRLGQRVETLVSARGATLAMSPDVDVDLRRVTGSARQVIDDPHHHGDVDLETLGQAGDLLPDWYDDWVLIERERFRQLRLHALELLCRKLTSEHRFAKAADAGLAAVAAEPLRESAHRALIEAHLAEGNPSEALRQYDTCRQLLDRQLGLEPSGLLEQLVEPLRHR